MARAQSDGAWRRAIVIELAPNVALLLGVVFLAAMARGGLAPLAPLGFLLICGFLLGGLGWLYRGWLGVGCTVAVTRAMWIIVFASWGFMVGIERDSDEWAGIEQFVLAAAGGVALSLGSAALMLWVAREPEPDTGADEAIT